MRDRALIGLMLYTVARIGSAARMLVRDYYEESGFWICRLHEKAGKFHQVPANHVLEGYMPEYLDTSEIWGGGEGLPPIPVHAPQTDVLNSAIREGRARHD